MFIYLNRFRSEKLGTSLLGVGEEGACGSQHCGGCRWVCVPKVCLTPLILLCVLGHHGLGQILDLSWARACGPLFNLRILGGGGQGTAPGPTHTPQVLLSP